MPSFKHSGSSVGFWLGLGLFALLLLFFHPDPAHPAVGRTGAVAALMAVWWITEALPLAATSLLPIVLFPLLGVMSSKTAAPLYLNSTIFLFLGGFLIALAMERWDLHRRVALRILLAFGRSPSRLVLGFMCACGFLSAVISNTATAVAMLPVGMAVLAGIEERWGRERTATLGAALMLGIAYSCSIGGLATLVGTPPNLVFKTLFEDSFPEAPPISFAQWSLVGAPLAVVMLIVAWALLTQVLYRPDPTLRIDRQTLREQYAALGPMKREEQIVAGVFLLTAFLWMFRVPLRLGPVTIPGWSQWFHQPKLLDDGTVAMTMAVLLFLLPARSRPGERLLDPAVFGRVPWHIILLFGGGFALAAGFKTSGLSHWLATTVFSGMGGLPAWLVITIVCLTMSGLTELTSNTASTQMVLPILAAVALAQSVNPLLLMVPATLSASMAFMMPVASPPNAIVFGSGWLSIKQMARAGIVLKVVGLGFTLAAIYLLGLNVFDLHGTTLPPWAK
jgi:sodium-dependent dicarboxylate transporter 2/3/5